MTEEELKNEMLTAIDYLRRNPMKEFIERNLIKLIFAVWFVERIYFYTSHETYFKSFCEYVEMILGSIH